jgi:hypothetical protein
MKPDVPGIRLPRFPAMEWIHSSALPDLEGGPLLVWFWDYTCLNCLRTLLRIRRWHECYSGHGLAVVGIHTPEFPFGTERSHVERAVAHLGINFPVALDNDFECWRAFHNRYWPARYLFDAEGSLRDYHFGEGDYEACERSIRESLGMAPPDGTENDATEQISGADAPGSEAAAITPEIQLGLERGRIANAGSRHAGEAQRFTLPGRRQPDQVYLEGAWRTELSHVESAGNEPAFVHLRCTAGGIHAVLATADQQDLEVDVTLGGRPVDAQLRSAELLDGASGLTLIRVGLPRLYPIVSSPGRQTHDLRLHVEAPGLQLYALSFSGPRGDRFPERCGAEP